MIKARAIQVLSALAVVSVFGILAAGPAWAAKGGVSSARRGCNSRCIDDCGWFEREFAATGTFDSAVYATYQCVISEPCYSSKCWVSAAPNPAPLIDRVMAAVKIGDAKFVSDLLANDNTWHMEASRQALQLTGCGDAIVASIPLSRSFVALLGSQKGSVATQ